LPALPQFNGAGKRREFLALVGEKIIFQDVVPVSSIGKSQPQVTGVALGLLQAGFGGFLFSFGLNGRNGKGIGIAQQVIYPARLAMAGPLTAQPDAPGGIGMVTVVVMLTSDLSIHPTHGFELGIYQLGAGIGFVEWHGDHCFNLFDSTHLSSCPTAL
jgi:hypothetical protein